MAEEQASLSFLKDLNESQTQNATFIANKAKEMGLNPRLAVAIAYRESKLNFGVEDGKDGEVGVMQVKIPTGKLNGFSEEDLRDPKKNVEAGLMYLKQGMTKFGDPKMAVVGYNAGMDHKFFEDPDKYKIPSTTLDYVKDIKRMGGFTETKASVDGTDGTTKGEEVSSGNFKKPTSETSDTNLEEGFLTKKAKDYLFDLDNWAEKQTPESVAETVAPTIGALTGAYASNKAGQVMDYLKEKTATAPSGGDLWRQNWAGQQNKTSGMSVPESSAEYQRTKNQGKISGRISKMYGPSQPTEAGVFKAGRLSLANQPTSPISPLAGKFAGYANAALDSPIGRKVTGALGGYGAVTQGMEAADLYKKGDTAGAVISGLGALGSGIAAIPTPVTRAVGTGMSMLSPAALWMLNHARKMSPEKAQEVLQGQDPYANPFGY
jgi:hypothetical protein